MLKFALNRLVKGSFVYGIGVVLQRFMGLLLLPFFTRALSPEDYGVVAMISLISIAMSGVFTLGTGNSMGIVYFRESDVSKRPTIIWSNILLMLGNGSIWFMIIFFAAPVMSVFFFQSDQNAEMIRLAVLGSILGTIADPFLAYLRMEEKAWRFVAITLMSATFTIALSSWFVLVEEMGPIGIILAGAIVQAVMLFIAWFMVGRRLPFHIDTSLFYPLVRIGFPSIFGLFAFLIIDFSDRHLIERMLSLDALGVYSIGYSLGMIITVAVGAFSSAWPAFFSSYINKPDEAKIIFGRVLTYYTLGFGALIVLFFFIAKPTLLIMTAPAFHEGHLIVGLVAASYMVKGCYLIVIPGIGFAEKMYKQSLVEWAAAVINIVLNIWLIPILGILGAALATFISYLTLPILGWFAARRHLSVEYEWPRLAKISSLVLITCSLIYFLSTLEIFSLLSTVMINSFVLVMFIILSYRFLLTSSERVQVSRGLEL